MKNIIRYSVLFILIAIAIVGIFSEPQQTVENKFLVLIISKAVAIGAGYLLYVLVNKWGIINVNDNIA